MADKSRQLRFRHFRCAAARRNHRPRARQGGRALGQPRGAGLAEPRCALDLEGICRTRRCARRRPSRARACSRGERIGIWSPNNAEWTITQFATAKAGLILVNINPAYRLTELEYALNKVGCTALVTATAFKTTDYIDMLNTLLPELAGSEPGQLRAAKLPQLRTVIQIGGPHCPGTIPFDDVARMGGARHREQLAALGEMPAVRRRRSTSSSPAAPPARRRARR